MSSEETIEQSIEIIYDELKEFLVETLPDNIKRVNAISKLNQSRYLAKKSLLIDKE